MMMTGMTKSSAVFQAERSLVFRLYLSAKRNKKTGVVCVPIYPHWDHMIFSGKVTAAASIPLQKVHWVKATNSNMKATPPRSKRLFHRAMTTTNDVIDVINCAIA
jgi:hypothetical protein